MHGILCFSDDRVTLYGVVSIVMDVNVVWSWILDSKPECDSLISPYQKRVNLILTACLCFVFHGI